jgi:hypothetical protein
MRTSTAVGLAGAFLGAGVVTVLAVRKARASPTSSSTSTSTWPTEPGVVPPPPDAIWLKVTGVPQGSFDSSQFFADWFAAHSLKSSDMTAAQRGKVLSAGVALGADAQGYIRWRATSTGQLTALAIADQLERETSATAQVLAAGVREYVNRVGTLPENPIMKALGV